MKNKLMLFAVAACMGMLTACAGNNAPKQGNDTVSKADVTKDTLGVDTGKNAAHDTAAGIKTTPKDTSTKTEPKK